DSECVYAWNIATAKLTHAGIWFTMGHQLMVIRWPEAASIKNRKIYLCGCTHFHFHTTTGMPAVAGDLHDVPLDGSVAGWTTIVSLVFYQAIAYLVRTNFGIDNVRHWSSFSGEIPCSVPSRHDECCHYKMFLIGSGVALDTYETLKSPKITQMYKA